MSHRSLAESRESRLISRQRTFSKHSVSAPRIDPVLYPEAFRVPVQISRAIRFVISADYLLRAPNCAVRRSLIVIFSAMQGDRFIPNRAATNFDLGFYMLTQTRKEKERAAALASQPAKTYGKLLAENMLPKRTRILAFQARPYASSSSAAEEVSFDYHPKPRKQRREISQSADRVLDAPDMVDDYYLNVLDWGSKNILSIALGGVVYLWNATNCSASELLRTEHDFAASVCWAPDGRRLVLGLNGSDIQLWDADSKQLVSSRAASSSCLRTIAGFPFLTRAVLSLFICRCR